MKSFDYYVFETEEVKKPRVNVEGFLSKIEACRTVDGCNELEKFYKKRVKEVEISDAEDIQIRDAINGRREELKSFETPEEETQEEF